MKNFIMIALIALVSIANAQTSYIKYTYDDNGNRKLREHITTSVFRTSKSDEADTISNKNAAQEKEEALKVIAKEGINLFPNPATDMVNINFNGFIPTNKHEATITDINGRVVLAQTLQEANNQLNVKQ
jgi:hypothetical protein